MPPDHSPTPAPSVTDRLRNLPQYLLPLGLLTRVVYRVTRCRQPWLVQPLIRAFVRHFRVDLGEAERSDAAHYPDFNTFFTRALRPGARALPADASALACPVDGTVSQAGSLDDRRIFQAKGHAFDLVTLLGGDPALAEPLRGGHYTTLYLSPRDYHRIHMPVTGTLRHTVHVPGKLYSVSPLTTRVIPGLFARNERVVCLFDTAFGPMALVLVGAVNVASIETVWAGAMTPPLARAVQRRDFPAGGPEAITLERGAEMGRFNMGSTVIVVFGPGAIRWADALRPGSAVRMGMAIGAPA